MHTFHATFGTAGTFAITATDDADGLSASQTNIRVHTDITALIPVSNRRNLIYDGSRGLLYITTSDGLVQRYDPATQTLLSPWHVGVGLYGADITPDGAFLYATEAVRGATQGMLHKVNLNDGTVTNFGYNLSFYEGGTWAVSIANNGKALFTSRFEGSGWVPLRQIDLTTDDFAARTDAPGSGGGGQVRQDTHIRRGGDRSLLFLMESNISNGPIFTYNAAGNSFPHNATTNYFLGASTGSVSRDGSLIAMKIGSDVRVMDASLNVVVTLHNLGGGQVFDATRDVLYAVTSTQIIAYDTTTWADSYRFDIGQTVPAATPFDSGEMTVSNDGALLFYSTPTGVRVYPLGGPSPSPSHRIPSFRGGAGASAVNVAELSVSIAPLGFGARLVAIPYEGRTGGGVLPPASLPFALDFESDIRAAVWDGAGRVDTLAAAVTTGDSWAEVLAGLTEGEVKDFWLKT